MTFLKICLGTIWHGMSLLKGIDFPMATMFWEVKDSPVPGDQKASLITAKQGFCLLPNTLHGLISVKSRH